MQRLQELAGTNWTGQGELWMDPLGNEPLVHPCELEIEPGRVAYRWTFRGEPKQGRFELENGVLWTDSFHQPELTDCALDEDDWPIFACHYAYPAGDGPDWGWRIRLSERPSAELVLQMVNVAPWGEEARAARMVFARQ